MKRDLFLESLQAQATGNHQRNSTLGKRPKTPRQRMDEIALGGSQSDQEYLDNDIDDLGHTQGGGAPAGAAGHPDDLEMNGGHDDLPNLATLQQGAHGGHPEEKPLLAHLKQARDRARQMGEEERYSNDQRPLPRGMGGERGPTPAAGGGGGSPHLRQEVEQIHQQLTGLLHRLKGLMAQM